MEIHQIPWPEGSRFTRIRIVDDGIPRDADVRVDLPEPRNGSAFVHVWHRNPEGQVPLSFVVETSEDGTNWIAESGAYGERAA
jgi:hypothetical protein